MKRKPYRLHKRGTKLLERIFWRRWNLDYTKRVLETTPTGQLATSLLSCWPERIQRALRSRYQLAAQA